MKLHHIGFIVDNIERYEQQMPFGEKLKSVFDPVQNATLSLYSNFSDSFIELIEPKDESAFTFAFLAKNGNGFHHLCYEVNSAEEMKNYCTENRYLLFKGPLKAILFDNKEVYFYYTRNKTIIEFLVND